jgi:hypothetical protein
MHRGKATGGSIRPPPDSLVGSPGPFAPFRARAECRGPASVLACVVLVERIQGRGVRGPHGLASTCSVQISAGRGHVVVRPRSHRKGERGRRRLSGAGDACRSRPPRVRKRNCSRPVPLAREVNSEETDPFAGRRRESRQSTLSRTMTSWFSVSSIMASALAASISPMTLTPSDMRSALKARVSVFETSIL